MLLNLLRNTIGHWSLELKCSLFFGLGLFFSICGSFWFIQKIAEDLVIETARQTARGYADNQIAWRHVTANESSHAPKPDDLVFSPAQLEGLRKYLVDNPDFEMEVLALDDGVMHEGLNNASVPSASELPILEKLQVRYRAHWREADRERQAAPENARINPELPPIFDETGPIGDRYYYYHTVHFNSSRSCADCHRAQGSPTFSSVEFTAENAPFRVVRVSMPYESTRVSTAEMLAVMIAVAMVTIAVTLLIFHLILRKLVIEPLRHLRNVSDEISRGKYDLRAQIGTDDEFNELADAFNRMLRHLTETQDKLRALNRELDEKVDQLAQANLNLYEANRLKSDFLANMSHELRTPLNSIIGFSDVLHDISSLTEKQKRYAANIQKSGRTLLEMINDILDLAKVEAGKMEVRPSSFDFGQVVYAQCDMMRSLSEEKNIDLQVDVPANLEPVFQDQPKFQQILTNLLSNAIKFTPEGGLINVSASSSGEGFFSLTVSDTGVGIHESDFEVIFEKFRQSNAILEGDNLARQFSGTGLGLSIVKELCRLLGGEVKLSSELGKGSTFCVVLPSHYQPTVGADVLHPQVAALRV